MTRQGLHYRLVVEVTTAPVGDGRWAAEIERYPEYDIVVSDRSPTGSIVAALRRLACELERADPYTKSKEG